MFNAEHQNNELASTGIDKVLSRLLFIQFIIATNPMFDFVGARSSILYLFLSCIAMFFLLVSNTKIAKVHIMVGCLLLLIFTSFAFYWQDFKLSFYSLYFLSALIVLSCMSILGKQLFIKYMYFYVVVMIATSVLSSIYFLSGGSPLFAIINPDGRINNMYLLSFSNSDNGFLIRPSGFFDEPGALSFHICMVFALRRMMKLDNKYDFIILAFGFVTLSLAHLVFLIFYTLSKIKNVKLFLINILIFLSIVLGTVYLYQDSPIVIYVKQRLTINEDGTLTGDSRTSLFYNAYSNISSDMFLSGIDSKCMTSYSECINKHGEMGENPLSPLVFMGGVLSLPYYLFLIGLVFLPRGIRNKILGLSIALLFTQRPYFYHLGYSLWSAYFILYLGQRLKFKSLAH